MIPKMCPKCREVKGWQPALDLFGDGIPLFNGTVRFSFLKKADFLKQALENGLDFQLLNIGAKNADIVTDIAKNKYLREQILVCSLFLNYGTFVEVCGTQNRQNGS